MCRSCPYQFGVLLTYGVRAQHLFFVSHLRLLGLNVLLPVYVTNPAQCNAAILLVISRRIFPRLSPMIFHRDASSALLRLVKQWLNFDYSRSHAFCYGSRKKRPDFVKNRTQDSALILDISDQPGYHPSTRATSSKEQQHSQIAFTCTVLQQLQSMGL